MTEQEADALLWQFQLDCEECVVSKSDAGIASSTKARAITRNAIRALLLDPCPTSIAHMNLISGREQGAR